MSAFREAVERGAMEDEDININLYSKLVAELKARKFKQYNLFNLVLLELKDEIKQLPDVRGRMYKYKLMSPLSSRFKNFYKDKNGKPIRELNYWNYAEHASVIPDLGKIFDYIEEFKGWREMTQLQIRRLINRETEELILNYINDRATTKRLGLKLYYVKICVGQMNLYSTPISQYSVLNLKYWDAKTKKTSNRGLKADMTYSWEGTHGKRAGYNFHGFDASILKNICKLNGMIIKKGQQYGDFAEWYIKL